MPAYNRPWLNPALSIPERVNLLLREMTVEEKVAQMVQISYSIVTPEEADDWAKRGAGSFLHILGDNARRIQRYATETRLGIPVIFGIDAIHGHAIHNGATVFPSQLALAASWDEESARIMGELTAREVTAEGLHWTFSPVFCLGRDLRWGRIDETFGEDALLSGIMGTALVSGYQGDDPARPDRILACAKHFIAYGESTGGRDSYDSAVTMRQIRDIFLPPFERACKAGCATVMAGYESIDGVPCSAHRTLLRDVLKDELGFEGFVVTDWSNVTSLVKRQRVARDARDAARLAIESGNDMIMTSPEFYAAAIDLVKSGEVSLSNVDEAARRILTVKFRAGIFDVAEKVKTLPLAEDASAKAAASIYNCPEHRAANLEIARRSIILLKNDDVGKTPALPLAGTRAPIKPLAVPESRARRVKTVAVIGPNADSVRAQLGDWTFFTHPVPHHDAIPTFRVTTMLEGISEVARERGVKVLHDKGCHVLDARVNSIKKATAIAKKADAVVVCVGDTLIQNGETHDRSDLALTGAQNELVESLSKACRRKGIPLVAVLVNGKPLEFERVTRASDAVIETFNSGTEGGRALAEILFGEVNPSARLPISFPRKTGQLPVYYNQLPGWHEGSYQDCPSDPLFAFGEGLSYSTFRYGPPSLSATRAARGDTVTVSVTVTNESDADGIELVQVYARDLVATVVTPVKSLKAFTRVRVPARSTVAVSIPLPIESLSLVNSREERTVEPGDFEILVGRDSRDASLAALTLTVI